MTATPLFSPGIWPQSYLDSRSQAGTQDPTLSPLIKRHQRYSLYPAKLTFRSWEPTASRHSKRVARPEGGRTSSHGKLAVLRAASLV